MKAESPRPSYAEYCKIVDSRKAALSRLIKTSGLTHTAIAAATGTMRSTIRRAERGEGICFDTAIRIEYYLEWHKMRKL